MSVGARLTLVAFNVLLPGMDVVEAQALARAKASDEVRAVLGEPIQPGFFVSGNFSVNGSSGNADFSIPLSGPKGSATLYVTATKAAGKWEFTTLELAPKGAEARIDLKSRKPLLEPQTQ